MTSVVMARLIDSAFLMFYNAVLQARIYMLSCPAELSLY